jgi:hypothetical protein
LTNQPKACFSARSAAQSLLCVALILFIAVSDALLHSRSNSLRSQWSFSLDHHEKFNQTTHVQYQALAAWTLVCVQLAL